MRSFRVRTLLVAVGVASVLPVLGAEAAPVAFGSHYYDLVLVADPFTGTNNSWETARDAAAASAYLGLPGHLATIDSAAENDFLRDVVAPGAGSFGSFTGAWLGGKSPEGWLTGPEAGQPFGYVRWGGVEPNNGGDAYMNIGPLFAGIGNGTWADDSGVNGLPDPNYDPVIGYFVEYEAAVPEPAAATLLAAGIAGLGAVARRRARR